MIRRHAAFLCTLTFLMIGTLLIGTTRLEPILAPKNEMLVPLLAPSPAPIRLPHIMPSRDVEPVPPRKPKQIGVASWYGPHWQGRIMASGKRFDDRKMTAAHRTLPLNTRVRVTNLKTGRSVEVTITDRGPYVRGRVIDLSKAAAKKLGMVKRGLAPVRITTIAPPPSPTPLPPTKVASLDMQ